LPKILTAHFIHAKIRMSDIAQKAKLGETIEIPLRRVANACISPIQSSPDKSCFYARVSAHMNMPGRPSLDIRAALEDGRK
jgi:hypothetical protein